MVNTGAKLVAKSLRRPMKGHVGQSWRSFCADLLLSVKSLHQVFDSSQSDPTWGDYYASEHISCAKTWRQVFAQRLCVKSLPRDLASNLCPETWRQVKDLRRDLAQSSLAPGLTQTTFHTRYRNDPGSSVLVHLPPFTDQ